MTAFIGFLTVVHVIICLFLIVIILIQAGRGGGLVEGFSGVESMFGARTNAFLTRATMYLSIAFFVTCVLLALLSAKQSRSLMSNVRTKPPAAAPVAAAKEAAVQPQSVTAPAQPEAKAPSAAVPTESPVQEAAPAEAVKTK